MQQGNYNPARGIKNHLNLYKRKIYLVPVVGYSFGINPPFGYGIGATQNSVPALMNRLDLTPTGEKIPIDVESEPGRVMLELGVVGFILFSFLRIAILLVTLRASFMIKDSELKGLAMRPGPIELEQLAEQWRPLRAVAARMLWQYYLGRRR